MQCRELIASELDTAFTLLHTIRPDLELEQFAHFLNTHSPITYRPLGGYVRGEFTIYAGVSIHENLELGRYLLIDDFAAKPMSSDREIVEMLAYIEDYAKIYQCQTVMLWGKNSGIRYELLQGFRPKRDGYIKPIAP